MCSLVVVVGSIDGFGCNSGDSGNKFWSFIRDTGELINPPFIMITVYLMLVLVLVLLHVRNVISAFVGVLA